MAIGIIGQGYLGCALANYFDEQGYEVYINSRVRKACHINKYYDKDIIHTDVKTLMKESSEVIWASGLSDVQACENNPTRSFEYNVWNLYDDLTLWKRLAHRPKFILLSSYAVFGECYDKSLPTETTKPSPISVYGKHKLLGETVLHDASGNLLKGRTQILRLPNVIGYDIPTWNARKFFDKVALALKFKYPITLHRIGKAYPRRFYLTLLSMCKQIEHLLYYEAGPAIEQPIVHVLGRETLTNQELVSNITEAYDRYYVSTNTLNDKDIKSIIHPLESKMWSEFVLDSMLLTSIDYKSILKQNGAIRT